MKRHSIIFPITLLLILLVGCHSIDKKQTKHIYYLHGRIIEMQGKEAYSEEFGKYEIDSIIRAITVEDAIIHCEIRNYDADVREYAAKVSGEIDSLIHSGVMPSDITVIGASKGAIIACNISDINHYDINYIFLGGNNDYQEKNNNWKLHGKVLCIYDLSDDIAGKDYSYWKQKENFTTKFEQIEIKTNLGHGFLYKPLNDWVIPAKEWIETSTVKSAQTQKIVLLKLDDVHYGENSQVVPPRWQKIADYIEGKKIKAGFGIIGYSLAENKPEYFRWIKDIAAGGYIEFWNHGYYNRTDKDTIGEFERSYDEQYRALFLTDSLAKANLGLTLHTWGPHWTGTNEDTDRALSNIPDIRMTLGSPKNPKYYKGYVFQRTMEMEHPVHNPNFEEFVKEYNEKGKDLEFFYLQGHPNSWDDTRWDNFIRIIEFLESENVQFVTPSEFMEIMMIR